MSKIEVVILANLIKSEPYMRKVVAFLKPEYFKDANLRRIYEKIAEHIQQYNCCPALDSAIVVQLEAEDMSEFEAKTTAAYCDAIRAQAPENTIDWLVTATEKFCQDRAVYNAIYECIKIIDAKSDPHQKLSTNAIPDLLKEALAVSFDTNIGHDYLASVTERHTFYHNKAEKIPFDLKMMNLITDNGIPKKSLSVVAAPTGGGKSIWLCHHAANCIRQGKNVLYITLEMSEERIAERIDANLMNVPLNDLRMLPLVMYENKFKKATQNVQGKLVIKEYPTSTANCLNFRHLMDELMLKKHFHPDVVIVDYLNICSSARYRASANVNSYTMVKAIAEELRGLAVERNVQLFTATQLNRSGFNNSDVDLTNTAESMGLPATADFFFVIISNDEMNELGQVMFKQLKNRYSDVNFHQKFLVGLDKTKMRFYDLNDSAQKTAVHIAGSAPQEEFADAFSNSQVDRENPESGGGHSKFRKKFDDWR